RCRRRRLGAGSWKEFPHDPVAAGDMAVLAEVEAEDLVEVIERPLGDALLADLLLAVSPELRDLALIEAAHPPERFRPVEEPAAEVSDEGRRLGRPHDLDRLHDLWTKIVLDPVEVVEQDLAKPLTVDDLLGELAAQVERLDLLPSPELW